MRIFLYLIILFPISLKASCIPSAFEQVSKEYGLPSDVFYAMSLQESGKYIEGVGFRVWPWALNINGISIYPASHSDAVMLIQKALDSGSEKIAVGVTQVYWRYHHKLFDNNPFYALDIGANLRAGAKVFREFIDRGDGLWAAVGYYHAGSSKKQELVAAAKTYRKLVRQKYEDYVKGGCHALFVG